MQPAASSAATGLSFLDTPATSWGRVSHVTQHIAHPRFADDVLRWAARSHARPRLAVGMRRSYGDTPLASGADVLDMTGLDRLIAFDPSTGILKAQAGLSLDRLMALFAPRGFFPRTCPGTRFVTLGGAIANDVHGKNHHFAGTFGCGVLGFTLLRSDRGVVEVTPETEPELFAATIGGLGLTGIILDVTISMAAIPSTNLDVETIAFENFAEFFALTEESARDFEHTVSWIDCTDPDGRGIFQRANWAKDGVHEAHASPGLARMPVEAPNFLLNSRTVRAFNHLYHFRGVSQQGKSVERYEAVFHPLDAIAEWNKLYGSRGFFQYQCVVSSEARDSVVDMLRIIAYAGEGSFLAVLKSFGAVPSPGMLSFPMPGYTLALDFPNRGSSTLALLAELDAVVKAANGRLYPAKDGRMPRAMFEQGYPALARFREIRDPLCTSDFWRRVS
jgi:L-gulonolactone oxidase